MAKAKRSEERRVEPLDKIANLMALIATKGANLSEQVGTLNRAGFGQQEIADLLNTNRVPQILYAARKEKKRRRKEE